MEDNIKYELKQEFNTEDYIHLNKLIKHDKNKQIDMKQIVQGLLIICVSFCFLSLLKADTIGVILACVGLSILSILYYFTSFVYRENTFFTRIIYRSYIFEHMLFYEDFMQVKNSNETLLVFYDDIESVFETEYMLYLKLANEHRYVFITKDKLTQILYFLKTKKGNVWHTMKEDDFQLKQ